MPKKFTSDKSKAKSTVYSNAIVMSAPRPVVVKPIAGIGKRPLNFI